MYTPKKRIHSEIVESVFNSNSRPTREPGVTPSPAGVERLCSWSHGIPAAVSPAPDAPKGWRVVVLPAPAVFPRDFTAPAPMQNSIVAYPAKLYQPYTGN